MTENGLERIEFSRPSEMPGAEVLLVERSSRRWRWFHETYTICAVLDGAGETEWMYRGRLHRSMRGGLLLMEPGEVHANRNILANASFRALFLSPALVADAAAELGIRSLHPHWKWAHTEDPSFFSALAHLHDNLERSSTTLELGSRFVHCLRRLLECCTESGFPRLGKSWRAGLRRARDFIHEHYSRSITLEELSAVAHISRFHLVRGFTMHFGLPPHAYQIHVRIERSRELLAARIPLVKVAAQIGFADQSHFGRHFKKINGITPGQYLESDRRVLSPRGP